MMAETDNDALQAQVSGSSFYAAMRIMPKAERAAMFALYRFCRLVDDIADDGTRARPQRAAELEAWRANVTALYDGKPAGGAAFLGPAARAFGLRQADFMAIIDGMDMDVASDIRAPDLATLDLYCDRVACAVGRLSTRIFGMEEKPGLELARELGLALQLTNILRDLDEDAAMGRLYLPGELLRQAGIATTDPNAAIGDPRVDGACRAVAGRALAHFAAADRLMRSRPRGRLLAPKMMEAVYRTMLQEMLVQGWTPPRRHVRIGKRRLLWIAVRCILLG